MFFLGLVDVDDRELRVREVRRHRVDRIRLREADADGQVIPVARERRQVRDVLLRRLRLVDTLLDAQLALRSEEPDVREVVETAVIEPTDVGDEADLDLLGSAAGRRVRRGLLATSATAGSDEKHEDAEECERSIHP